MLENLREKCIYTSDSRSFREDEHIFFTYLYNMRFDCIEQRNTLDRECAEEKMTELGIDANKVQQCISDSFMASNNFQSNNDVLSADRTNAERYEITLNPTVVINR